MALPAYATATWTTPAAVEWLLTEDLNVPGVSTLDGVAGIGAAPRAVSRRPLATGGTVGRWSHADERLIAWPLEARHIGDAAAFTVLWRALTRAFTSTSPPAGTPTEGVLRIARADGTWREISATYLSGLEETDQEGEGLDRNTAVVSLVATDPWWYGETVIALDFSFVVGRSYLAPYETVSPTTAAGAQTIVVDGDVDALPVWTLTGPGSSFTVTLPGGSFTFAAALAGGQSVVVDVGASTVIDNLGANRIGDLTWPGSVLATLPAGSVDVTVGIVGGSVGAGVSLQYRPRYEGS